MDYSHICAQLPSGSRYTLLAATDFLDLALDLQNENVNSGRHQCIKQKFGVSARIVYTLHLQKVLETGFVWIFLEQEALSSRSISTASNLQKHCGKATIHTILSRVVLEGVRLSENDQAIFKRGITLQMLSFLSFERTFSRKDKGRDREEKILEKYFSSKSTF